MKAFLSTGNSDHEIHACNGNCPCYCITTSLNCCNFVLPDDNAPPLAASQLPKTVVYLFCLMTNLLCRHEELST